MSKILDKIIKKMVLWSKVFNQNKQSKGLNDLNSNMMFDKPNIELIIKVKVCLAYHIKHIQDYKKQKNK